MFVLSDIVAEGKQQLPSDPTCTDLPCSRSDPEGNFKKKLTRRYSVHYKDPFVSMSPGAKVEPALVEDITTKLSLVRSLLVRM